MFTAARNYGYDASQGTEGARHKNKHFQTLFVSVGNPRKR
jgi:hypothetical protein